MGTYSVPEEIKKHRPTGTMIKKIKDHFYVYEHESHKEKQILEDGSVKWKTVNKIGKCIGQITSSDGFIENDHAINKTNISVLEYGCYQFVTQKSSHVLEKLKAIFNTFDAYKIYVVATIFLIEGFTDLKNVKRIYDESYLKLLYPNVKVGSESLKTLYEDLGRKGTLVDKFVQSEIDQCSHKIVIEKHILSNYSCIDELSQYGSKAQKLRKEQINCLTAHDLETKKSIISQIFNDADLAQISVQSLFSRFKFENTLFVVDQCLYSTNTQSSMSENGNSYIMPMLYGSKDYIDVYENIRFEEKDKSFIFDQDGYSSLIYYSEILLDSGVRCIAFKDTTKAGIERAIYLKQIQSCMDGFTKEGLLASDKDFGLLILQTSNLISSPKEIFCEYKTKRINVSFYQYIDHNSDFSTLLQYEYCKLQGVSFIVQIASMILSEIRDLIDLKNYSLREIFQELKGIKAVRERNRWMIRNYTKSKREMCHQLNLEVAVSIS